MKKKKMSLIMLMMLCILWLAACQSEETQNSPSEKVKAEKKELMANHLPVEGFIENVGWLSNWEILTVRDEGGGHLLLYLQLI